MESNKMQGKNNPYLLSEQVQRILKNNGFSAVFNFTDYQLFKRQTRRAFNQAQEIAQKFMAEAEPQANDFQTYIF
ncbi:hypothetical protein [Altibacter sp. HG106]|uniref:hypothetical protein n=1 Tax=Altibacter sp. HG106 TaxID=3023937 RepID=UPI002350A7D0|nr:hypothetical protein [Altibacter sp. HG106]MDC7994467.1 hypothetical protein [Altibacter sp. HG106]